MILSKRLDELTQPQYGALASLVDEITLDQTPSGVVMRNMQAVNGLMGRPLSSAQWMELPILIEARRAEGLRKDTGELIN